MNSKMFAVNGQPIENAVFVFPPREQAGFDFESSYDAFRMKKASERSIFQSTLDFSNLQIEGLPNQMENTYAECFPKESSYEEKMLEYLDNPQFSFLENSDKYQSQILGLVRYGFASMNSKEEGKFVCFSLNLSIAGIFTTEANTILSQPV
jgi:hypothetical protein